MTKLESYLGFAMRSGKIIFGSDKLFVAKKIPCLVIICSSQNEKVSYKVLKFCEINKIHCVKLKNLILGDLVKRDNCKVLSIMDENLSNVIRKELEMDN